VAYVGARLLTNGLLEALLWGLRPDCLLSAAGVAFLVDLPGGAAPWWEALAVASGAPVPFMALRAVVSNGLGVRMGVGACGLGAWAVSWHSPWGHTSCRAFSLLVSLAGLQEFRLGSLLVLGRTALNPAFPDSSADVDMPAQGVRTARWRIDVKPTACASSCCHASCKEPILKGELRVRSAACNTAQRCFHLSCVDGGLGPEQDLVGFSDLGAGKQAEARRYCDQPGCTTRADYVDQQQRHKRVRLSDLEQDPGPEQPLEELLQQRAADHGRPLEELCNMEWWDQVSYDSLGTWVPTCGKVPQNMLHAVARVKGTLAKTLNNAATAGDVVLEQRCWKAVTFLDRLLFAQTGARRGGKGKGGAGLDKVLGSRLRRAWRGDWSGLWAEAYGLELRLGQRPGGPSPKEDARTIDQFIKDGLLSKAIARARGALRVDLAYDAVAAVLALFRLPEAGITFGSDEPQVGAELREELVKAAEKTIKRFPKRSSPGPNGSRFEHWGVLAQDAAALREGAKLVVAFLLGECPPEALEANLGARLVPLRKQNGGVRPVAMGSTLRRLAARAACAALKEKTAVAAGAQQYGVGRPAGCELLHKSVTALTDQDSRRVVMAFDAANAFGTVSRQRIWDSTKRRLPELAKTVRAWLRTPATHFMWDAAGKLHLVRNVAGVDQGCPLSPLLFALGVADELADLQAAIRHLDPTAQVFAYLDDVVVVCVPEVAQAAAEAVADKLGLCGLKLNQGKTQVWSKGPPAAPLPAPMESLRVPELKLLGASVAWLDREDRELDSPVHATSDGAKALSNARGLVQRLRVLREAGLSPKAVFLILQTYGLSSLNHLQRANYESGRWVDDFDQVLFEGLEDLLGDALTEGQRSLAGLRFADGGLAYGGARARSSSAFLASWALCLHQVAELLGASSMDGLSASCPNVCTAWRAAEADLRARGGSGGRALLWHSFLEEAAPKLQGVWSQQVRECAKDQLLTTLSDEAAADVQSNGGAGAGGFAQLGSDSECVPCMPQAHFVVTLRDRLLLPLSPEGARCQHRRSDTGLLCGALLDRRGKHARMCAIGGGWVRRHNSIRDWAARTYTACCGLPALTEQRVPEWDLLHTDTATGAQWVEEAVLDVATAHPQSGSRLFFDAVVATAYTTDARLLAQRARKPGLAAAAAAAGKRRRYAEAGAALWPLAFEAGGRPSDEAAAFVRQCGAAWARDHAAEDGEPSPGGHTGQLWRELSTLLHQGTADMILGALGR